MIETAPEVLPGDAGVVVSISVHPDYKPDDGSLRLSARPLTQRVIELLRTHLDQIDGITRAYVSPDGLRFVACGPLKPGLAKRVAQATYAIQEAIDPTTVLFIDGSYVTAETPIEGWLVAFVRS